MKRSITKLLIILAIIAVTIVACTYAVFAEEQPKSFSIRYHAGESRVVTDVVGSGKYHFYRSAPISSYNVNKTFFGWYELDGTIHEYVSGDYTEDLGLVPKKDMDLYELYGAVVTTESAFKKNITSINNCVRLGADITINGEIDLSSGSGYTILDLNGYTLTINSDAVAFKGTNAGIHIIDSSNESTGKLVHKGKPTNEYLMDSALFAYAAPKRNVEIRVINGVDIETNAGLFDIVDDISDSKYTFNFVLDGSLTGSFLVRSYGIKDATISVADSTYLNIKGLYMLEDRGNYDGINLFMNMDSGKLDITSKTYLTNEPSKYTVYLTGASYNRSLSNLYPNYTFVKGEDERYTITECKHNHIITDITATCTEAGVKKFTCSYCGISDEEPMEAIGHSTYKQLEREAVSDETGTYPGCYAIICTICGERGEEEFFPAPKDTFVNVVIRTATGGQRTVRVKATLIFGESVGDRLSTFSTQYIETKYVVKQEDIISIEIPLGVKVIAGGIGADNSPNGLFANNTHLEEIILPSTIETVEAYAFAYMSKLKSIKGIEYISNTISKYAFKQNPDTVFNMDRLVINAKKIESQAFYNITAISITFGENVEEIGEGAFGLDAGLQSRLLEIFVAKNPNTSFNRGTLKAYNDYYKHLKLSSGHQFDGMGIVYYEHNYKTVVTEATCQSAGYATKSCEFCGDSEVEMIEEQIAHNYVEIDPIPSTCVGQGRNREQCTMCGDIQLTTHLPPMDPNNPVHDYTYASFKNRENTCEQNYHIIGVCKCGAKDPVAENWEYVIAKGEHTWDKTNPVEEKAADCGNEGYKIYKCKECGMNSDKQIIKATGRHVMKADTERTVPATCSTKGTLAWICKNCGYAPAPSEADLNPNNHEWELDSKGKRVWTTIEEPTADEIGKAESKCTGCGRIETKPLPIDPNAGSSPLLIVLIVVGSVIVVAGIGITLYFTIFRKSPSTSYKYKFNTLNKK